MSSHSLGVSTDSLEDAVARRRGPKKGVTTEKRQERAFAVALSTSECREIAALNAIYGNEWQLISKKRKIGNTPYDREELKAFMYSARRSKKCQRNFLLCKYSQMVCAKPGGFDSTLARTTCYLDLMRRLGLPPWELDAKVQRALEAAVGRRQRKAEENAAAGLNNIGEGSGGRAAGSGPGRPQRGPSGLPTAGAQLPVVVPAAAAAVEVEEAAGHGMVAGLDDPYAANVPPPSTPHEQLQQQQRQQQPQQQPALILLPIHLHAPLHLPQQPIQVQHAQPPSPPEQPPLARPAPPYAVGGPDQFGQPAPGQRDWRTVRPAQQREQPGGDWEPLPPRPLQPAGGGLAAAAAEPPPPPPPDRGLCYPADYCGLACGNSGTASGGSDGLYNSAGGGPLPACEATYHQAAAAAAAVSAPPADPPDPPARGYYVGTAEHGAVAPDGGSLSGAHCSSLRQPLLPPHPPRREAATASKRRQPAWQVPLPQPQPVAERALPHLRAHSPQAHHQLPTLDLAPDGGYSPAAPGLLAPPRPVRQPAPQQQPLLSPLSSPQQQQQQQQQQPLYGKQYQHPHQQHHHQQQTPPYPPRDGSQPSAVLLHARHVDAWQPGPPANAPEPAPAACRDGGDGGGDGGGGWANAPPPAEYGRGGGGGESPESQPPQRRMRAQPPAYGVDVAYSDGDESPVMLHPHRAGPAARYGYHTPGSGHHPRRDGGGDDNGWDRAAEPAPMPPPLPSRPPAGAWRRPVLELGRHPLSGPEPMEHDWQGRPPPEHAPPPARPRLGHQLSAPPVLQPAPHGGGGGRHGYGGRGGPVAGPLREAERALPQPYRSWDSEGLHDDRLINTMLQSHEAARPGDAYGERQPPRPRAAYGSGRVTRAWQDEPPPRGQQQLHGSGGHYEVHRSDSMDAEEWSAQGYGGGGGGGGGGQHHHQRLPTPAAAAPLSAAPRPVTRDAAVLMQQQQQQQQQQDPQRPPPRQRPLSYEEPLEVYDDDPAEGFDHGLPCRRDAGYAAAGAAAPWGDAGGGGYRSGRAAAYADAPRPPSQSVPQVRSQLGGRGLEASGRPHCGAGCGGRGCRGCDDCSDMHAPVLRPPPARAPGVLPYDDRSGMVSGGRGGSARGMRAAGRAFVGSGDHDAGGAQEYSGGGVSDEEYGVYNDYRDAPYPMKYGDDAASTSSGKFHDSLVAANVDINDPHTVARAEGVASADKRGGFPWRDWMERVHIYVEAHQMWPVKWNTVVADLGMPLPMPPKTMQCASQGYCTFKRKQTKKQENSRVGSWPVCVQLRRVVGGFGGSGGWGRGTKRKRTSRGQPLELEPALLKLLAGWF
ncbi:hypothetical protein HXX76_002284 [Chlamydomonas incerta]|uniref:Uncharacterized protein n=1 Tax=Chlamydomonas incerta TaxID=51695 RepID=A0A836B078_CHLIN|nr:hypothetical protein HXX76_002284 [Chlamydomonas incerta]|eukprot:KAG2443945.1 hypothetical protein HXX76_002284 [Chlamydomonas incerta]